MHPRNPYAAARPDFLHLASKYPALAAKVLAVPESLGTPSAATASPAPRDEHGQPLAKRKRVAEADESPEEHAGGATDGLAQPGLQVDWRDPSTLATVSETLLLDTFGLRVTIPKDHLIPPVPGR